MRREWWGMVLLLGAMFCAPGVARAVCVVVNGTATAGCASGIGSSVVKNADVVGLSDSLHGGAICNSAGKCVDIPAGTGPRGDVPAGWSDGDTPPTTAGAPTITYEISAGQGGGCTGSGCSAATRSAVCSQWLGGISPTPDSTVNTESECSATFTSPPSTVFASITTSETCPAGYSASGGVCTLSNAALVMKPSDNRCGMVRTGNVIAKDSRDPDCGSGPGTAATALSASASGGTGTAGTAGHTLTVTVDSTSGNVTLSASTAGTGTTSTTTINGGADGGADVPITGTITGTVTGTGTATGGGGDITCGLPGTPACRIDETGTPTGEGALASADSDLTSARNAQIAAQNALTGANKVTSIGLTFGITLPTVECADPTFAIPGTGKNLVVPLCAKQADVNAVMTWFAYVLTALYLFRLIYEIS